MKNEIKKPRILIFSDYYLPGYKSGGGMRTIVNMVDRLNDKFDFWIITRDHDGKLDKKQYENVKINEWNTVKNAKVFYLSKDNVRISKLRELILEVKPNSIYTNSFFATLAIYVLKLRKLGLIPNINITVAPCGELSSGSLRLKSTKKKFFVNMSKLIGLYQNVIWKASSDLEKTEIEQIKGKGGEIFISPDLPPRTIFDNYNQNPKLNKEKGNAKMIFLSRFMRKKNFKWLLENLFEIKGKLEIDIFGPLEDEVYWNECLEVIKKLPENIKVEYKESIPFEQVLNILFKYHFFILPTISENFGHVFLEALAAGCPLIISDRTPWLNLSDKKIGWDIPLENPKKWQQVINHCISMNNADFQLLSENARKFSVEWLKDKKVEEDTLRVLEAGLSNTQSQSA